MAFPSLSDLEDRLEWELEDGEKRVGTSALEDLAVDAANIAGTDWGSGATVPKYVWKTILSAAVRYMRNLEGLVQSRAGDETVIFNEIKEGAGSAHFTKLEIEAISRSVTGLFDFGTIPIIAHGDSGHNRLEGYRPTNIIGEKLYPMFRHDDGTYTW